MTVPQLITILRARPNLDPAEYLLYLANHVHEIRLADGQRLNDATDFIVFLRELAEASRTVIEVSPAVAVGLGLRAKLSTCHRCGHIHKEAGECGAEMGPGRICRCELEVRA